MNNIVSRNASEDNRIKKRIMRALAKNINIDTARVSVDVADSIVYIKGFAGTTAEKLLIESTAIAASLGKVVKNNIQIKTPAYRNEACVMGDILECLSLYLRIDLSRVLVRVRNGVVFLIGTVPTSRLKLAAEMLAGMVPDVTGVINKLEVSSLGQNNRAKVGSNR